MLRYDCSVVFVKSMNDLGREKISCGIFEDDCIYEGWFSEGYSESYWVIGSGSDGNGDSIPWNSIENFSNRHFEWVDKIRDELFHHLLSVWVTLELPQQLNRRSLVLSRVWSHHRIVNIVTTVHHLTFVRVFLPTQDLTIGQDEDTTAVDTKNLGKSLNIDCFIDWSIHG